MDSSVRSSFGVATRSYDDQAIRENTTCSDSGGIGTTMCVYAEKMEGELVAGRAARVLKLAEVGPHEKTYVGDIDGDGIADRYVFNLDIQGNGPNAVEYGRADGSYSTQAPTRFRNSAGQILSQGQTVDIKHRYDTSRETDQIASFRVSPDARKEVGASQYLLVSVEIYTAHGEIANVDQCSKR